MSRKPGTTAPRSALRARLVAAPEVADRPRTWPPVIAQVIDPAASNPGSAEQQAWRPIRVHGGPGSGKTALIVDAAVARLLDPATDPESVLVLASSRRAAVALREEITRRVLSANAAGRRVLGGALREPLVRTVHSYAFAILRLQASAHGNPPPRLITGSEQDVVLRELLAGDIEDGAHYWPAHLRPALGTDGFAQALRDLMMRAAERGVGPEELAALGREHKRPEWTAAARAYAQYEQNMLLRGAVGLETPGASAPAVDAAELIGSALSAFATDPELLSGERRRIRHLLVDDAQHLDPQAAQLIRLVGTGTTSTIIAADTDQSVFGFRGASPRFADELADPGSDRDIVLEHDFRSHPDLARLGRAIAARLPGARPHAYPEPVRPEGDADVPRDVAAVRVYGSTAKEATAIADLLRRAHLFDGVPWSQMAVIVRSVSLALPPLRRAFRSAGVPVTTPASDLPLHRQRAVIALMLVLRVVAARREDPTARGEAIPEFELFTTEDTLTLLSGPVGAADPGAMRRLRRGIRRLDEKSDPTAQPESLTSLTRALLDPELGARYRRALTETEAAPLARVLDVVAAGQRAHDAGRGVEETLWAAWQATGLERRWAASAVRGGPAGEQADRDLDAVMAMFEAAANFADTLPAAGPAGFVHYLSQLQIPRDSRTATAATESVTVLSAHAAVGREWEVVAVAGVQDGLWPSLRSRGGVLSTGALVDILDGMDAGAVDTVARGATALADERRLFLVACTRARSRLLVTAVEDGSGDASPSRFLTELADLVDDPDEEAPQAELQLDPGVDRVLSLPSLVATLRSVVMAGAHEPEPDERTRAAARLLAVLADSDIPGAHPRDWFGLAAPSTDAPLWTPDNGPVVLSPSNVEALNRCSLRWVLERNGGRDGDGTPALTGSLVHTLVQAVAGQLDPAEVTAALRGIWDRVDTGAGWYSARELERAENMLGHFRDWLRISRADLDEVGVELPVDATIPGGPTGEPGEEDAPDVRLRGRVDRLETDSAGRPVVVDVKTSKTPITKADADEHAQMAAYQVALAHGGVPQFGDVAPGGARLVYVSTANRNSGAAERVQSPLTPELLDEWIGVVRRAARASIGPTFTATPNPGCVHCNLSTSCPAKIPGKAVTDD
ncbi:ATP-dependent helicase [Gordonia amicalis]|uniref:DNA 3'-5' helicase n=1 Tax=Gordonia amicalis TaxID=89053 RepID=A0AAE4R3H1_9ACTN|nr:MULTISPECIES: ATP-dependent DNA helicase [Gordonia]ATD71806.1 ATP-dependent DNA helicase [Gordonia sp. 1D]MDV6311112.1 ATP-dependent DNA helicase [Gordonia amicalis]MDV7101982.1 ATP-dependent DNA helicase [Gordonia amicalis]UPW15555.1 ATP-dependent helicase [Gordonia amicalis]